MHHLYLKSNTPAGTNYKLLQWGQPIFGCNRGIICNQLAVQSKDLGLSQPCGWQLDLRQYSDRQKELRNISSGEIVIVVDLKPRDRNISLYEVANIWGYSAAGWTPMMWEMKAIFIDEQAPFIKSSVITDEEFNLEKYKWMNDFCSDYSDDARILTFNHTFKGSIIDGKITGTWNPPGPASLNGCLLWPETMEYFKKFF